MKAFKDGLIYFIKTQLMISIVFNFVLVLSYLMVLMFFYAIYGMIDGITGRSTTSSTTAELIYLTIPLLVFFVCGLYYTQKKKPGMLFARYFSVVFPIIVILFSWLFYAKIYVMDYEIPLTSLPYNWIYFTPIGFFITEGTEIGSSDASGTFIIWILPLITYVLFLTGYILGEIPFSIRFWGKIKRVFKH